MSRRIATIACAASLVVLTLGPAGATPEPPPASAPASPSCGEAAAELTAAHGAFARGDFAVAARRASCVADGDPLAARARHLEGYARYKLGLLEPALATLRRAPAPRGADVALLEGLICYQLGRLDQARQRLTPIADDPRFGVTARELLRRIGLERAAQHAARERGTQRERDAAFDRLIRRAKSEAQAGRYRVARATLDEAERLAPGNVVVRYYRGYLAYQRGDRAEARRWLKSALAVKPDDDWSRYMLALSQDAASGGRFRGMLDSLASGSTDPEVKRAARRALRITRRARPAPRGGLWLEVEAATGLDTNPAAFVAAFGAASVPPPPSWPPLPPGSVSSDDVTCADGCPEPAMLLSAQARIGYRLALGGGQALDAGLLGREQAYAGGQSGLERTDLGAWIGYGLTRGRLALRASYGYTFQLFGHQPQLSSHELSLMASLGLPPRWLRLFAATSVGGRQTHDDDFGYLGAIDLGGALGAELRLSWLSLRLSYHLLASFADTFSVTMVDAMKDPPKPPVIYTADHSNIGHGPELRLAASLPWRLELRGGARLLLHRFDEPARLLLDQRRIGWQQERSDQRVLAWAELARPIRHGVEAAVSFTSDDNFSTLDADAVVNQTYHRRVLSLLLRWRWPFLR